MEELYFNDIDISMDNIIEQDSATFSEELKTSAYRVIIKQARLKMAQNSQAKAISLLLDIKSDIVSNTKVEQTKELDLYFLNKNGEPFEFGVNKIGSLLSICGLPTKISQSCFTETLVVVNRFDSSQNKYVEVKEPGYIFNGLAGKDVNCIIGMKYEFYNDKVLKKYDLNSFYNAQMRSVSEIKNAKEASSWKSRLEFAIKKETESYEQHKHLIGNSNGQSSSESYNTYKSNEMNNGYQQMQQDVGYMTDNGKYDDLPF